MAMKVKLTTMRMVMMMMMTVVVMTSYEVEEVPSATMVKITG